MRPACNYIVLSLLQDDTACREMYSIQLDTKLCRLKP